MQSFSQWLCIHLLLLICWISNRTKQMAYQMSSGIWLDLKMSLIAIHIIWDQSLMILLNSCQMRKEGWGLLHFHDVRILFSSFWWLHMVNLVLLIYNLDLMDDRNLIIIVSLWILLNLRYLEFLQFYFIN